MADSSADAVDRLVAGELTRAEERRLAQSALDDPHLFDTLTAAALVRETLVEQSVGVSGPAIARRRTTAFIATLSAAAAIIVAVAYGWTRYHAIAPAQPRPGSAVVTAAPIDPAPVLLAARFDTPAGETFRTAGAPSRLPKQTGTIVGAHADVVEFDVGALDGVTQGAVLRVRRSDRDVGRLKATAVFRERARGMIEDGATVHAGDTVTVDAAAAVRALLEHADARSAANDFEGARVTARMAVARAEAADGPAGERRRALLRLASLERRLTNNADAGRLLREAVDAFDTPPAALPAERAEVLNELGVVQIERRDLDAAARSLEAARSVATGGTLLRATNNLGALAAIRGDRAAAERAYRAAAALAAGSRELEPEREAIDKNLAALQPPR